MTICNDTYKIKMRKKINEGICKIPDTHLKFNNYSVNKAMFRAKERVLSFGRHNYNNSADNHDGDANEWRPAEMVRFVRRNF